MAEVAIVAAARMAAVAAATAVAADARPRVTAVAAGVRLRAMAAVAGAIRHRAADPRTVVVGRHMAVDRRRAVAADMDGDTVLDSFPAWKGNINNIATLYPAVRRANRASHCFFSKLVETSGCSLLKDSLCSPQSPPAAKCSEAGEQSLPFPE